MRYNKEEIMGIEEAHRAVNGVCGLLRSLELLEITYSMHASAHLPLALCRHMGASVSSYKNIPVGMSHFPSG